MLCFGVGCSLRSKARGSRLSAPNACAIATKDAAKSNLKSLRRTPPRLTSPPPLAKALVFWRCCLFPSSDGSSFASDFQRQGLLADDLPKSNCKQVERSNFCKRINKTKAIFARPHTHIHVNSLSRSGRAERKLCGRNAKGKRALGKSQKKRLSGSGGRFHGQYLNPERSGRVGF